MLKSIKRLFGVYESGHQYYVHIREIVILPMFKRTWIGKTKFQRKNQYYDKTGEFESKIILDKNFVLLDGYSSYKIAKLRGIDKVPVYFQ